MTTKLQQAITLFQQGDKKRCHQLLVEVLKVEPHNESAWLLMAYVFDSKAKQKYCLEKVLTLNPNNKQARAELLRLELETKQVMEQEIFSFPDSVVEKPISIKKPIVIDEPTVWGNEDISQIQAVSSAVSVPSSVQSSQTVNTVSSLFYHVIKNENTWAFPLALVICLLLTQIPIVGNLLGYAITLILHEIGHAIIFWLRGIFAIPSFGVTLGTQFSWGFFLAVVLISAIICAMGLLKKRIALVRVGLVILILLIMFTFIIPEHIGEQLINYGGLGGELYLSTGLIILFYYWPFFGVTRAKERYFFLVFGMIAFYTACNTWWQTWFDVNAIPMGALIGPASHGDLNRLQTQFGWSIEFILRVYYVTTLLCLITIIGHYVYFIWLKNKD